mmetsp:Transcript_1089/g.1720  ORF Transcript_1089/g.1720 Transcript_1089/m.1720 type:complete len:86 (-) Transcript_1089:3764-4021(-)
MLDQGDAEEFSNAKHGHEGNVHQDQKGMHHLCNHDRALAGKANSGTFRGMHGGVGLSRISNLVVQEVKGYLHLTVLLLVSNGGDD